MSNPPLRYLESNSLLTGLLISLSGSFQTAPIFFLNEQNGVNYNLVTQTPQYAIQSLTDLQSVPVSGPGMIHPEILADVASITRSNEMEALSHYNIRRAVDIYGSVQGRDLNGVGRDISRIVNNHCASCHHPDGAAFSLMTYGDARPWAVAIKEEILRRRMPPWGAIKGFGEFRNDQALTPEEMERIVSWADGGVPEIGTKGTTKG